MARPPDPRIRARLRDQAVDYVLSHGIADLSLRRLARALHTNARMLVYHFGSREGLMREILFGLRERGDRRIQTWLSRPGKSRTLSDFLRWYWSWMTAPAARPVVKLIFELYGLALRSPRDYPGVLEDPLVHWKTVTKRTASSSKASEVEATLMLAATRGLLLDLCATGDLARVEKALRFLARLVESSHPERARMRRQESSPASHRTRRQEHKQ